MHYDFLTALDPIAVANDFFTAVCGFRELRARLCMDYCMRAKFCIIDYTSFVILVIFVCEQ